MYFFRKSNNNNVTHKYYEDKQENDDFVIVNDGMTQSGWVDVNNNNNSQQQQQQPIQPIVESNNNNIELPQKEGSQILPIFQIKQEVLSEGEQELVVPQQQEQFLDALEPNNPVVNTEFVFEKQIRSEELIKPYKFEVVDNSNNNVVLPEPIIIEPKSEPVVVIEQSPKQPEVVVAQQPKEEVIKYTSSQIKSSDNQYTSTTSGVSPLFRRVASSSPSYSSSVSVSSGFKRVSTNQSYTSSSSDIKPYYTTGISSSSYTAGI